MQAFFTVEKVYMVRKKNRVGDLPHRCGPGAGLVRAWCGPGGPGAGLVAWCGPGAGFGFLGAATPWAPLG